MHYITTDGFDVAVLFGSEEEASAKKNKFRLERLQAEGQKERVQAR